MRDFQTLPRPTDDAAVLLLTALHAQIHGYLELEIRWQRYAERGFGPDEVLVFGENGADLLDQIHQIVHYALDVPD